MKKIKLLEFYAFDDLTCSTDLSGIWQTTSVRNLDTEHPIWGIERKFSVKVDAPVNVKVELPSFCFEHYGRRILREHLFGGC